MQNRYLVFSDLDGTLLDHDDYSFSQASEALGFLKLNKIPLILATSKTFAEVVKIQEALGMKVPCIVENGAGIFIPSECVLAETLSFKEGWIKVSHAYSYLELRLFFKKMQREYDMKGFGDMSVKEIMECTGLDEKSAEDAKKRDFTEPFLLEDESVVNELHVKALQEGLDIVKGGRFFHLISQNQDKANAMLNLTHMYDEYFNCTHKTIALGDSANDFTMLKAADKGVLVQLYDGSFSDFDVENIMRTNHPGPKGWNQAVLELLADSEGSMKSLAKKIFADALEASLPQNFVSNYCSLEADTLKVKNESYDLSKYENIYVFGSGKAAVTMAGEMEKLLGGKIQDGLVVAPSSDVQLKHVEVCEGSHPIPTQKSLDATQKLLERMQKCSDKDLFIYLLSGGSSALTELPISPISLEDFQETTQLMLHNNLEIHEINTVRKHISQVKGGRLAQLVRGEGIVLVLSDIIDDDLHSIGSAPMYADRTTYKKAKDILEEKSIFHELPQSVQEVLQKGINGKILETPKHEQGNIQHFVIASNQFAVNAALKSAQSHGLSAKVVEEPMQGNVESMIAKMLEIIKTSKKRCIIFGGECTVQVDGDGQGGRNQHAVALMLREMCKQNLDIAFLSAGTDGVDGNSDAAGAVVDKSDCRDRVELDGYIKNCDTYNYFRKYDSLVVTGATGTNVIDIAIIVKGE